MSRAEEIATALGRARARLTAAARVAGRDPDTVALLPVTKYFPASDAQILYDLGCREFGESREQEAAAKIAEFRSAVPDPTVRWHMIGRLQRNKAKAVARWAYAVHSVDSERLVDTLGTGVRAALDEGVRADPLHVLLQVSLDADPRRGGVPASELESLATRVESTPGLVLRGLMGVPPLGTDPAVAFARLADVHAVLQRTHPGAVELSAGMTGDLEAAVRCGSTCVRVGTALLGPRPIVSK